MAKSLLLLLALMPLVCFGQNNFKLNGSGCFETQDGKDYVVLPCDGKTAHELYDIVRINVGKTYNSPKMVMSVVEDKSIAISAYVQDIIIEGNFVAKVSYECDYNLQFDFKDGKIRVGAPKLGEMVWKKSAIDRMTYDDYSASTVISKKFFDKKGKPKKKKMKDIEKIEERFNELLNALVAIPTASDDW